MSEKLKIKLSIANRVYPLTIDASQEEGLRKAAKNIEVMIKQFEQSYSVRDKQDVLAMCALQFASQVEQKSIDKANVNEHVEEKLNALNMLLQKHI
ncbi:cell division protein ZapA [uncultured Algibacter sp.]|uniref:cell division protein ZapA n=1 Tax=uncultured Algibacter sp. TaxID=298659 RepID=UPI0026150D4F|nr:cell division protein ZapA [uncultured Algibacter sp.]